MAANAESFDVFNLSQQKEERKQMEGEEKKDWEAVKEREFIKKKIYKKDITRTHEIYIIHTFKNDTFFVKLFLTFFKSFFFLLFNYFKFLLQYLQHK